MLTLLCVDYYWLYWLYWLEERKGMGWERKGMDGKGWMERDGWKGMDGKG
jgi:hypothetical protein